MNVTRKFTCAALGGALLGLPPAAALAGPGLSAWAGEDGRVEKDRQCDVYVAGVATRANADPLHFRWLDGARELTPWREVRADGTAPVELCGLAVGRHELTLEVTDGRRTVSDTMVATIVDAAPAAAASCATEPASRPWEADRLSRGAELSLRSSPSAPRSRAR